MIFHLILIKKTISLPILNKFHSKIINSVLI